MGVGEDLSHESLQDCKATLEAYLEKLEEAVSQIAVSADQCSESVELAVTALMRQLETTVAERKSRLLADIAETRKAALAEAGQCRSLVEEQLRQADQLISCAQADADDDALQQTLLEAAEDLVPSLPPLSGLSRVSVHFSPAPLLAAVRQFGRVETTVAVGGVRTEPRPGAVLVTWSQDEDEEDDTDGSTYRLEYCYGDAQKIDAPVYHLAYEGSDTSALVRRLQCDVTYSFRVSRQEAAGDGWGEWSQPVTGSTNLPHYEWSPSPDYSLTDSGRIASRVLGSAAPSLPAPLLSSGAQLRPGAALRVLVVEAGAGCSDEGVALLDGGPATVTDGSLAVPGALFVSATGEVYVDGVRRQMRLPPLRAGSHVTFNTERRRPATTRVWLETDDKQVVYDWHAKATDLWLAASFNELGWKLLLE